MEVGVEDFVLDFADDDMSDGGAEAFENLHEEIMGEGAGRLLPGQNSVDRGANRGLDVEDDRLLAITEKDGASGLGGQEGDGFDLDEIDFHENGGERDF